jgi:hypothetical protein
MGCTAPTAGGPAESESTGAVKNGMPDSDHPEVVRIRYPVQQPDGTWYSDDTKYASGVLIGPNTVLTTSAWLGNVDEMPTDQIVVDVFAETPMTAQLTRVQPGPPGVAANEETGTYYDHSIALLTLNQTVDSVTPATLSKSAPAESEPIVLVGYNGGDSSKNGGRNIGHNTISQVLPFGINFWATNWLTESSVACNADQGGPVYVVRDNAEVLVGISYGCLNAGLGTATSATRVDGAESDNSGWIVSNLH